jgi:hypothetical protein
MKPPTLARSASPHTSAGDDLLDDEGYDQLSESIIPVGYYLPQKPGGGQDPVKGATATGSAVDPCAYLLPTNVPPGVSVDQNIALAAKLFQEWLHTNPPEPGAAAANFSTTEVNRTLWFIQQTGDRGPMDYKYLTTDMRYDDFGNFNYGAVGMAIEFTPGTLLRVAGWVQQQGKNAYLGRGTAPSNKVKAFLGVGGVSPFGDKPGDQIQIANGIKYYNCRKAQQRQ